MEPAISIIAKLGGAAKVSQITGTDVSTPYTWCSARGTAGFIPRKYHQRLIAYAHRNGIPLSAAEFIATEINNNKKRRSAP